MPQVPIDSSHIKYAEYDSDSQRMVLTFQNGSRYSYANMTPDLYTAFLQAPSQGEFLHRNVIKSLPGTKV